MTDSLTPHFKERSGAVVQTYGGDDVTMFDPKVWGRFSIVQGDALKLVHAVRIPGPFQVGADVCRDGWLVYDGKLKAIGAETFVRDYSPVIEAEQAA